MDEHTLAAALARPRKLHIPRFRTGAKSSLIPLLVLSPKSLTTFRGPHFSDFHDKRHIVAAGPHTGGQRLHIAALGKFNPAVGRMVFQCDSSGNNTCPKCGRTLFLVADGAALGRMLGAETR